MSHLTLKTPGLAYWLQFAWRPLFIASASATRMKNNSGRDAYLGLTPCAPELVAQNKGTAEN
jgi:hypothetical protein